MNKEGAWPATVKVDIEPEGLKRVVKDGRLIEFVDTLSTLAAEQIKTQIVEKVAAAGVGLSKQGEGVSIVVGFEIDDKYGTGPKPRPWPWPWPWFKQGLAFEQGLRQIVREELDASGMRG